MENAHLSSIVSALPFGLKSTSNGSLSDSGISDGGGSSDYGLSERERRLSALRRLARQLENALAPGSAALNSISQRMEAAEADLKSLQDTCRELIVRTAASQQQQHHHQQQQQQQQQQLVQQQQMHEQQSALEHLPAPHKQTALQQQEQQNIQSSLAELIPAINYSHPQIQNKSKQQKRSPQR